MHPVVGSHHTAWIRVDGPHPSVQVRYAVSGEMLVVFGDGPLAALRAGGHTTVTVHEIAGGPPLVTFGVTVSELGAETVDREALLELLAHVPLGPDLETVNRSVDTIARSRRILALTP